MGFLLFFRVVSGDYGKPWKTNMTTPRQLNSSPLKIGRAPKLKVIFQPSFFRGYVKLRGCSWKTTILNKDTSSFMVVFVIVMLVFRGVFPPCWKSTPGDFFCALFFGLVDVNIFRYFHPKKQLGTPTMNFAKLAYLYFWSFRIFNLRLTHVPFSLRSEHPLFGSNLPAK